LALTAHIGFKRNIEHKKNTYIYLSSIPRTYIQIVMLTISSVAVKFKCKIQSDSKHCSVSWMYKTDSAKQHFCGSVTRVVQYVLLCLFLAVSFKTLKHILLNAAEDTPTLQAFLLSFQVKSCRHCLFFCGTFMCRAAQTHTHEIFWQH